MLMYMRGLNSAVVKSLGVVIWKVVVAPPRPVVFPWYLWFSPPRLTTAGHDSSVDSDAAWYAIGTAIDPRVRHIFLCIFGHENNSKAILSLPLFKEEQLSINDERMCAMYW